MGSSKESGGTTYKDEIERKSSIHALQGIMLIFYTSRNCNIKKQYHGYFVRVLSNGNLSCQRKK